jgi:hypothetical protein
MESCSLKRNFGKNNCHNMKILKVLSVFLILFSLSETVLTNSGGAPSGYTGAPGEGNCTNCHSGTVNSGSGSVTISIAGNPSTYVPGQSYDVTVYVRDPFANKFGFQATAVRNSNNQGAGTMSAGSFNQISVSSSSGKSYANHNTSPGIVQFGRRWTFVWTAPAAGTGAVTIYASGNVANNDRSTSGDEIYTNNLTINEAVTSTPPVISSTTVTACQGDTIRLQQTTTQSITWFFNGVITSQTSNNFSATQSGNYYAVNGNGDSSNHIRLVFNPKPAVPTVSQTGQGVLVSSSNSGNQWYFNGAPIAGSNGPSITISSGGVYWVTTTNSFGCSSTSQPFYSALGAKGGVSTSPKLYPNPSSSPTLDLGTWEKAEVMIWDAQGKVVFRKNGAAGSLVLPELFAGIYTIEVRSNNVIWKQKWINPS